MNLDYRPLPQGRGEQLVNYRDVAMELMEHPGASARVVADVTSSDAAKVVRGLRSVAVEGAIVRTRTFKAESAPAVADASESRDVYAWAEINPTSQADEKGDTDE